MRTMMTTVVTATMMTITDTLVAIRAIVFGALSVKVGVTIVVNVGVVTLVRS